MVRINKVQTTRWKVSIRMPGWFGFLLGLFLIGMALPADVLSEPYFSVRDGYKCSKCHVNRTGGSKRNDYAQVYMNVRMTAEREHEETESPNDAEAPFFSGRLNEFVSMGADVRTMVAYSDQEHKDPEYQFDRAPTCAGCHQSTNGGGKRGEVYWQLEPVPHSVSLVATHNLLPTTATREVYALLETRKANAYLKAGLFRLPTGLQNTWDAPFIHGDINQGFKGIVGVETVRGQGVEVGTEPGPFSISLSMTNALVLDSKDSRKRIHLNAYGVIPLGLFGVTAYRDPIAPGKHRSYRAVYGGINLGRLTGLIEVDQWRDVTEESGDETRQAAGLAQLDVLIVRGHNLKLQYEVFDPDRTKTKDIADRTSLIYEPFLNGYLQVRGGVRENAGPKTRSKANALNASHAFVELHLFF